MGYVNNYVKQGVTNLSVLTESEFFGGSLTDLVRIKREHPTVAVLRKDFLISEKDIDISFRAGADAVLLIASILSDTELKRLYKRTKELGMEALVEVHSPRDIDRVKKIRPTLVGINSRNLKDFRIDLLHPVRLKSLIDWDTRIIFESGIRYGEDVALAISCGFNGVLVGESVMRDARLLEDVNGIVKNNFKRDLARKDFWQKLYKRLTLKGRTVTKPLVKICGITNREDAELAVNLGADLLGFVFASSVRRARPGILREIHDLDVLKVGVVVTDSGESEELLEVRELLEEGLLDAIQFHGEEKPDECFSMAFPYYKAIRIRSVADIERVEAYRSPRVLIDAYSTRAMGGTGKSIPDGLVKLARRRMPLWLAGGLGPENVREAICRYKPELIDASSKLEAFPGKKDVDALRKFFTEIEGIEYAGCS